MTIKQAKKLSDKMMKVSRFGMLMENYNGVWIYECRTVRDCHSKRFRGTYDSINIHSRWKKHIYTGKEWEGFMLDLELCRTDWKVTVVSGVVLDAILTK
jgi:hypothetical protein